MQNLCLKGDEQRSSKSRRIFRNVSHSLLEQLDQCHILTTLLGFSDVTGDDHVPLNSPVMAMRKEALLRSMIRLEE